MSHVFTASNHLKYMLATKEVDLDSDTFKMILLRDGLVFNKRDFATYNNLKATSGSLTLTFVFGSSSISRATGSFITDGFVVGNRVGTTSAINPGPFTIVTVSALQITVAETIVNEVFACVMTAQDELASGNGYTTGGQTITGLALTEDDTDDRAELVFDDLTWTASGGDIGPTSGAMIIDDTTADKTIVGNLHFGSDQIISDGGHLHVMDTEIRIS